MPPKFDYEQEEYDYGYERYGSPSDMDEDDMPQPDDLDEPWLYEFRVSGIATNGSCLLYMLTESPWT